MMRRAVFIVLLICLVSRTIGNSPAWQRLVNGDVVLYCHVNDMKNGERIIEAVKSTYPRIMVDLHLTVPDSLTVFLTGSKDEFHRLTRGELPEWSAGATDPKRSILYLQSPRFADPDTRLEDVVEHELGHAVLGMAVHGARVDRWFDEGFAMMESGDMGFGGTIHLIRGFVFDEALRLSDIEDVLELNRDQAVLAYQESLAAVKYFVQRFGTEGIAELVSALREGKTMDEAVHIATGIPYAQFQDEWFDAMKRKYRTAIALDFSLVLSVAFVTLFAAAWVTTRIRTRKKKKEWDQETEQDVETRETNPPSD